MSEYRGIVQQGVVILQGAALPEGTEVTVVPVQADITAKVPDETTSIWRKLAQLGRDAELEPSDLPPDLAANHDHYLHGLSRRQ